MSLEIKKEQVKTAKKFYEASAEQRIETEIVLPDYCKEIKKLLKCTFVPGVHTVSLSGERASAKGTGTIRVLYLGEGDIIDIFEKNCDLSSSVQMKDVPSDAVVRAKSQIEFLNCRVTGQRKLFVSAGVGTAFYCYSAANEEFIIGSDCPQLQTKTNRIKIEELSGFFEKTFDMSETVVLNAEHPPVGKILSCNGSCSLESHKLSSGKLLVKGDVNAEICYLTEKEENKFHCVKHSMPISQIVDVPSVDDSAVCDITLNLSQLLCSVKADSSGANRLADISARVSAFVFASEKKERNFVTDCYHTEYELESEFASSGILIPVRDYAEGKQFKGEIELPAEAREICRAESTGISQNIRYGTDKMLSECSALISILYIDEKGVPSYCEKNFDFEIPCSIVKKCKAPVGDFAVSVKSVSAEKTGRDKLEITLDCNVKCKMYCRFEKNVLKNLKLNEDKPKKEKGAALSVYFPQKGENLWDIARSHNSTAELIMLENELKDEKIPESGMLLVPCV